MSRFASQVDGEHDDHERREPLGERGQAAAGCDRRRPRAEARSPAERRLRAAPREPHQHHAEVGQHAGRHQHAGHVGRHPARVGHDLQDGGLFGRLVEVGW